MGSFRVLIAGPKHFTDYPTLRAVLDKLLANRLPDVELPPCGVSVLGRRWQPRRESELAADDGPPDTNPISKGIECFHGRMEGL
jgi:hypothetical protein